MSPEKIAIAVAVTMAAIAIIGGMKNVTGTSSAVAIAAVSPGPPPTNRPNADDASITITVFGSKTIWNAMMIGSIVSAALLRASSVSEAHQYAPRQRHTEQFVERVVNDECDGNRDDDRRDRPHAVGQ